MEKILLIRSKNAFLPEIDAYIEYFNNIGEFRAYDSSKLKDEYRFKDFDIIWEFKGFGGSKVKEQILVHEYPSLSTGVLPRIKNILKYKMNTKPNLRIFLNETVRAGFQFNDDVGYCFRDMGIDKRFLQVKGSSKEYDFVYVGSISKGREIDKFLGKFAKGNNGKLCLVGNADVNIYKTFKNNKDITFTGKIPYSAVPEIASKAVYGINYVPDKYPFNLQTSTKLIEYLSLGLKVVTTDYKWVKQFEEKHGCLFYKLDYYNLDFNIDKINKGKYISKFKAEDFIWENVIKKSGIEKKLKELTRH